MGGPTLAQHYQTKPHTKCRFGCELCALSSAAELRVLELLGVGITVVLAQETPRRVKERSYPWP